MYPEKLLNKKLYLAAGVAAAFECKTTLRAADIEKAVKTCGEVKNLYPAREGTPYKELHAPIVYGLLAHSHSWKGPNSTPENNIERKLRESDAAHVLHPRQTLDLFCVADVGTWISGKITFIGPPTIRDWASLGPVMHSLYGLEGSAQSTYARHTYSHNNQTKIFTPIGTLISNLSRRLAWEDPTLRDLADYYQVTKIGGTGEGGFRQWPISIYSENVRGGIEGGMKGGASNIMV